MVFLYYKNNIIKKICDSEEIYIYGAGTMGRALKKCLSETPYSLIVQGFIVKSLTDNSDVVDGLPVYEISEASQFKESLVLIALNGKYIPEVIGDLSEAGFKNVIPVSFDGDIWTDIRSNWILNNKILKENVVLLSDYLSEKNVCKNKDKLHIYVVHSIYDKELSTVIPEKPYEIPIQVGAALTDREMYPVRDCIGEDNISEKNRKYCELTGIYWAWKNDDADYIGFSHYRRRFLLKEVQLDLILSGDFDIITTQPIVNFDTVLKQYGKDHDEKDWFVLAEAIKNISPEYTEAIEKVQNSIYYFAYNMYIMKKDVFKKYCEFIFPILEYCEKKIGEKEDVYQNRYVGFLAERLLSIYLEKNNNLKVAIADKTFLE